MMLIHSRFSLPALLFATLFFAAFASGQSGRVQPKPTPPADPDETPVVIVTEEVKMNILAFDPAGKFVHDVKAEDLVVSENDILHQAASLRRIPANVLIVLDTGGELRSMKTLDQTRKTARELVKALPEDTSIAIVQYADDAELVLDWTTDREAVNAAIGKTKFGRRSAFVKAVQLATDVLTEHPSDNRHMVMITDGTDSFYDGYARQAVFREILSTDINVHVITYTRMEAVSIEPRTKAVTNSPPPKAMPDEVAATLPPGARDRAQAPKIGPTVILDRKHLETMRKRKAELEASEIALFTLTENTNGTFVVPESYEDMLFRTASVARNIDASYVLTYIPKFPFSETGGERTITVTSRRPGLIVQATRKLVIPNKLSQ